MSPLLLILLVILLIGGGAGWRGGYLAAPYGYGPLGLILIVIVILALFGRL
jgi:hypothetical protein